MKKIVISQPMYFPWLGIFEQINFADVFVHYDDVKLPGRGGSSGNFINRVQIKTPTGFSWMTVPIKRSGVFINEELIDETKNWKIDHKNTIKHNYARAPFGKDAAGLFLSVLDADYRNLAELNIRSIEACCDYMGLKTEFIRSSTLGIPGKSSERLLNIIKYLGGDKYITGHGAKNYLDFELFERNNIDVEFMDYKVLPWPQLWRDFNPYVSILDLIANTGSNAINYFKSGTVFWREFLKR